MITPDFARLMATYNKWQNESVYGAASTLSDHERRLDRGAFFRSIHETMEHILWADEIWLSRFGACAAPTGGIPESTDRHPDWAALQAARAAMDALIVAWATDLTPEDLSGDLIWYSGAAGRELARPRALLIAHIFNHQTHHRGQVHAMLTTAGAKPDDTDIPFMPSLADES